MFEKVNHIGIAVRDIDSTTRLWTQVFGLKPEKRVVVGDMIVVMVPIGEVLVELLAPASEQGVIAKFLEKRGEGIHHVCFEVANIREAMKELAASGMELIDKQPRVGAEGEVAFIHPKSTNSVLMEIVQVRPER